MSEQKVGFEKNTNEIKRASKNMRAIFTSLENARKKQDLNFSYNNTKNKRRTMPTHTIHTHKKR